MAGMNKASQFIVPYLHASSSSSDCVYSYVTKRIVPCLEAVSTYVSCTSRLLFAIRFPTFGIVVVLYY